MILKDLHQKTLTSDKYFIKVTQYTINIQKSIAYLHTNNEETERNQENNLILNSLK
jgi:hypothetical protein